MKSLCIQNVDVCLTFAGFNYGWIMKNQSVESDPFHDKLIHITKPVWMINSWIRFEFSSWVQLTESMIRSQCLVAQWQLQVTFRSIRHTILHMNLLSWFIRKLQFPIIVNTWKSQIISLFKFTPVLLHKTGQFLNVITLPPMQLSRAFDQNIVVVAIVSSFVFPAALWH